MTLQKLLNVWTTLSPPVRTGAVAGAGVLVLALLGLTFLGGRSCGERADVETRVAALSAQLQEDAASGKITVSKLAERIKTLNAAATAFETSKDLSAYCEALDTLGEDFKNPI